MVLQGLLGEEDQTDSLGSCWGFLGSSSTRLSQECCCTICLCLQMLQQCPPQVSQPLSEPYCQGENRIFQVTTTVVLFKLAELWCGSAKLLMGTQIDSFPHPAVLQLLFFILGPRNISLWSESGSQRGCKEPFQVQHGAIPSGCCSKVSDDNIMNFRSHLWVSGSSYTVLACPEINSAISQLFITSRKWKLIIHLHLSSEKKTLNWCWPWE